MAAQVGRYGNVKACPSRAVGRVQLPKAWASPSEASYGGSELVSWLVFRALGELDGPIPRNVEALGLAVLDKEESSRIAAAKPGLSLGGMPASDKDSKPFMLSEALPVVPAKLVRRIHRGEFVDMAELLKDNMEAERRRAALGGESSTSHGMKRVGRREVPDLLSWLHCYSLFTAVVCESHPEKVREMWAYQATMIAEAWRCGGRGWLIYDSAFRQQITSLGMADFGRINQSLYATTFLAYGGRSQCCPTCMQPDHGSEECALNLGKNTSMLRVTEPSDRRPRWEPRRNKGGGKRPCFAWNEGRCSLPYCRFDHVCVKCYWNHRRETCRAKVSEGGGADKGQEDPRGRH